MNNCNPLDKFLKDLAEVEPFAEGEEEALTKSLCSGEKTAESRLMDGYLQYVYNITSEYFDCGMFELNLVEIAFYALKVAVEHYTENDDGKTLKQFIEQTVRQALVTEIDDYKRRAALGEFRKKAKKVNRILSLTNKYLEETGIQPEPEVIANELGIDVEFVRNVFEVKKQPVEIILPEERGNDVKS